MTTQAQGTMTEAEVARDLADQMARHERALSAGLQALAVRSPVTAADRIGTLACRTLEEWAGMLGASPACVAAIRAGRLGEVASVGYWPNGQGALLLLTPGECVVRILAARRLVREAERA